MMNLTLPEIPERMKKLPTERGMPVPYIVKQAPDGTYLFTVNDGIRQHLCAVQKLCPICGYRLEREMWYVGGPMSAFHPHGCYYDSAMHSECLHFALVVCPYLALRKYDFKLETRLPNLQEKLGRDQILLDPTIDSKRPAAMVAVMSHRRRYSGSDGYSRPERPYQAVEFWKHGEQISHIEGLIMCRNIPDLDFKDVESACRLVNNK